MTFFYNIVLNIIYNVTFLSDILLNTFCEKAEKVHKKLWYYYLKNISQASRKIILVCEVCIAFLSLSLVFFNANDCISPRTSLGWITSLSRFRSLVPEWSSNANRCKFAASPCRDLRNASNSFRRAKSFFRLHGRGAIKLLFIRTSRRHSIFGM